MAATPGTVRAALSGAGLVPPEGSLSNGATAIAVADNSLPTPCRVNDFAATASAATAGKAVTARQFSAFPTQVNARKRHRARRALLQ